MSGEWLPLTEAASEVRRIVRDRVIIRWGFVGFFCGTALLVFFASSENPLWFRAVIPLILVVVPFVSLRAASAFKPSLFETPRIPTRIGIFDDRLQVEYEEGPPIEVEWGSEGPLLTILEVRYPGRDPLRWLHVGQASMYQGIRLNSAIADAIRRAAEIHRLAPQSRSVYARRPPRELVWVSYSALAH